MSAVSEGSRRVAAAEEPQNIIRPRPTISFPAALKASPGAADSSSCGGAGVLGLTAITPCTLRRHHFTVPAAPVKSRLDQ